MSLTQNINTSYSSANAPAALRTAHQDALAEKVRLDLIKDANARCYTAQHKHTIVMAKDWITMKLQNALKGHEEEGEIEIDFKRLNCEVNQEFGPLDHETDSCRQALCSKGEVVPAFVPYLFACEKSGDAGGEDEKYFFHITDRDYLPSAGLWFVEDVCLEGKSSATGYRKGCLKWMYLKVTFKKVEQEECVVSGDYFPTHQMVTNGDTWMSRDVYEGYE